MRKDPDGELMPELQDILNRVHAFNASHPEGCFVFSFLGFEKDENHICDECDNYCDKISDKRSMVGALGDIHTVRELLNHLRDIAEEECDEEGVVSF